jgi:hypothetical protein
MTFNIIRKVAVFKTCWLFEQLVEQEMARSLGPGLSNWLIVAHLLFNLPFAPSSFRPAD